MKNYLIIASLAVATILPGCTVPQMAVESNFKQQAEELPVKGRKAFKPNGSFIVGNYTVANVERGWVKQSGFSIFGYHDEKATQKYQLSLQNGQGSEWYIFGASYLGIKSLQDGKDLTIELDPAKEYYASHFTSPESGSWRLVTLDPRHYLERKNFEGELSNGNTTFKIAPVYQFEGKSLPMSEIIGYEFRDAGGVVGAVQVINNGKVWLKPELGQDTRMVLASAMASLLLYNKLDESLQNN